MPSNPISKSFVKYQIDAVRGWIGRDIDVHTPTRTDCTLCLPSGYYDSTSDSSYYTLCPVCAGKYWLDTTEVHTILARVHWAGDEAITATPGGKYFVGDAAVTVDPMYLGIMQRAQSEAGKIVVDGREMQIMRINPRGAPEINRYRVILKNMGGRVEA